MKSQIDETIRMREAVLNTYQSMGLKACGQYDLKLGLKQKMTGWGVVSAKRAGKPYTRSSRVRKNRGK